MMAFGPSVELEIVQQPTKHSTQPEKHLIPPE